MARQGFPFWNTLRSFFQDKGAMRHYQSFFLFTLLLTGWGIGYPAAVFSEEDPKITSRNEYVILLHGLGRTRSSLGEMERYLTENGYHTINVDYPSTKKTIDAIVQDHLSPVVDECGERGAVKIHFVTHSLGGIVLRHYLQNHPLPEGSRVVMIAPPNHGSELADFLKKNVFFKWLLGPSLQELGTGPESLPNRMKPLEGIDVGVITGATDLLPIFGALFSGPNDGKVSVESAKLEGMKAFKIVPCGHTFIMNRPDVMEAVDHFFCYGIFKPEDTTF